MTQAERVLDWLQSGKTITTLDAFEELGITRIAARVFELKEQGVLVKKRMLKVINRYDEACHVAEYFIEEKKRMNKLEKLQQDVKDTQAAYYAFEIVYANTQEALYVAYEVACDDAVYGDNYGSALADRDAAGAAYDAAEIAFELATKTLNDYLEKQGE